MKPSSYASRSCTYVLLADSNQTQSQLLSSALRRQAGFKVICCRSELSNCLQVLQSTAVDVLLLGDRPTDRTDLMHTLRALHAAYPRVALILLLDSYDRSLVVDSVRAGARGLFCRANLPFRALCRCISVVQQGQLWANTEQIGYVIDALNTGSGPRVINFKGEGLLTPRQDEIVNLVAEGTGNREIAEQLGIKENTVKKSLLRIYDKIGVTNRVELVLYALTHRSIQTGAPAPTKICSTPKRVRPSLVEVGPINLDVAN